MSGPPLPFSPVRLPPPREVLSLEDRLHILLPGHRLIWHDEGPRATFTPQGSAASGGQGITAQLVGGGFAALATGEWAQPYLVPLGALLQPPDEVVVRATADLVGVPRAVAGTGQLVSCVFKPGSTQVQLVLGAPGAEGVADCWYTPTLRVETSRGRRITLVLPAISCPG